MDERDLIAKDFCGNLIAAADALREAVVFTHPEVKPEKMMALTLSQERLLKTVRRLTVEHPDGVPLKMVADRLQLSASAVSIMVDLMVTRGELERNSDQRDRRVVLIRLSESGRRIVAEFERAFSRIAGNFLGEVPLDNQKRMVNFLKDFIRYVNAYRDEQ